SSGCSVTLSVNITIRPLPTISAWTTTPDLCEGGTAFLYASGGTSYSWSGPYGYSSTFQNPIIINIPTYMTGTYTVTGANEYGCIAKANVFITVQSVNAIVNATPNPVPYGGTLYLTASGGTSYQWAGPNGFHTTQQNPIIYKFSKPNEGLYSCIVSSSAGCQDTKIILVQIKTNGIVGQEYVTEKIEGTYLQVYPNPASTSIKLDGGFARQCDYQILNGQGQIVMSGKSSAGEQIQISTLAPGAYYIHWIYQNDNDNKISNISRFVKTN
ncbi:MAG TPA: T9SS type A sorting domain-containing protein, partial [Saprospiraceae bacterium]|nr:T9SS type A sorting domain-containing protein [Saprospiraceae bacterium]